MVEHHKRVYPLTNFDVISKRDKLSINSGKSFFKTVLDFFYKLHLSGIN